MKIGPGAAFERVAPCERGDAVAVVHAHARDIHFEGVATRSFELGDELTQRARREFVAVGMGDHHGIARADEGGEDPLQFRPFDRHMPWPIAAEPAIESGLHAVRVAASDEFTGDVRARGNVAGCEYGRCDFVARQLAAMGKPLADTLHALEPALPNIVDERSQRRRARTQPDQVDGLPAPLARRLDAGDETHAVRLAREPSFLVASDGVVIGKREQTHTTPCRSRNELSGSEHAIRMMAVGVQVDQSSRGGRGGHRTGIIGHFMTLPLGVSHKLDDIDTVLLDLDGTLLDLAFDNYLWLERVPVLYGAPRGLDRDAAMRSIEPRFRACEGTLDWYSVDYWSRELGLDVGQLHRDESQRIAWLPGAREFLLRVRALGKRLVLLTNAHPVTLDIKHGVTGVRDYFDAAFSSAEFGAPKEDARFWSGVRAREPFDPHRSMFVDDSRSVLRAARAAGIAHVIGIKRPDSSRAALEHEGFPAIDGVAELARD